MPGILQRPRTLKTWVFVKSDSSVRAVISPLGKLMEPELLEMREEGPSTMKVRVAESAWVPRAAAWQAWVPERGVPSGWVSADHGQQDARKDGGVHWVWPDNLSCPACDFDLICWPAP